MMNMMFSFGCAWMHYMEKYFVGSNQTIFPHYPDSKIYCFFALNVVPEEKKNAGTFFPLFITRLSFFWCAWIFRAPNRCRSKMIVIIINLHVHMYNVKSSPPCSNWILHKWCFYWARTRNRRKEMYVENLYVLHIHIYVNIYIKYNNFIRMHHVINLNTFPDFYNKGHFACLLI